MEKMTKTTHEISPEDAFSFTTPHSYWRVVVCPICGHECYRLGDLERASFKPQRGDELIAITAYGKCGSEWQLCFSCHGNELLAFISVLKPCKDNLHSLLVS